MKRMDSKQKAIEALKKQIQLSKERLGPEGIKQLQEMAKKGLMPGTAPAAKASIPPGSVPYDKKAALEAFQLFLKNHGDPAEFERRLKEMIARKSH